MTNPAPYNGRLDPLPPSRPTAASMDEFCPEFKFRGDRDYLHSSTMFDHLIPLDGSPTNVDFAVHRMTGNQCTVVAANEVDGRPLETRQPVATYRSDGMQKVLLERADSPLSERYPCNERDICSAAEMNGESSRFSMPPVSGASYIEAVVGVYKHLLQSSGEEIPGKLVFARMTVKRVPTEGECRVEHRRAIKGGYFQATLFHGDEEIGKLVFGLV